MKIFFAIICFFIAIGSKSQTTCASSYDNAFNNTYIPTHYFPGPMLIPFNTNINGRIEAANDIDYYKFTITTGGSITLALTNLPANYQLSLVNSNGNTIATSAKSGTTNESIQFSVTSNTVYFALVYPANNKTFNASACYTLRVNTGTANRISSKVLNQQMGAVFPNPVQSTTTLQLNGVKGNAKVRIIDRMGVTVRTQTTKSNTSTIDMTGLTEGLYIIDVVNGDEKRLFTEKIWKRN